MASVCILYATGEGQTEKVATRIADVLADRGHEPSLIDATEIAPDLAIDDFDAVLVGASIHAGRHQRSVRQFVSANRDALASKPTAFFQVSLTSAGEDGEAEAAGYVESFVEATDWHPDRIGLFGGALRFTEYGFLKRLLMKQISKRTVSEMPEPDPAGNVEFTDWDEVEAFAADVAAFVEGRLGITPPAGDDGEMAE